MAILGTIKKFIPYVKTTAGYVAYRLSSQAVQMDNGKTLETTISDLNNKLVYKVETGSGNGINGNYIKWSDGTLEVWATKILINGGIKNAYGPLYQGTATWTYPVPFIKEPDYGVVTMAQYDTGASWGTVHNLSQKEYMSFRVFDIIPREAAKKITFCGYAKGKWK